MKKKTNEPNKETLKAFKETDEGKGLKSCGSFEEFKLSMVYDANDLNNDQTMAYSLWMLLKMNKPKQFVGLIRMHLIAKRRQDLFFLLEDNPTIERVCEFIGLCYIEDAK